MKKFKKICISFVCILIPSTVQVICKNEGVILGAIPTLILFAPFIFIIGKQWDWWDKKKAEKNEKKN